MVKDRTMTASFSLEGERDTPFLEELSKIDKTYIVSTSVREPYKHWSADQFFINNTPNLMKPDQFLEQKAYKRFEFKT